MTDEILSIDKTQGGKFYCTVRKHARGMQLQGSLCRINIETDHVQQTLLGRIGMVNTTNLVHDNPAFSPLIMEEGLVRYFSKDADVESTVVEPVACIDSQTKQQASRKANPSSGTPVYLVTNEDVRNFMNERDHMMYIGYQPGFPDVILSIVSRHCGDIRDGGWGEAKHRMYAGQNGSGKTVLALQHLAGRAVRYPQMGVLIPDTKGDIARDMHSRGDYRFSFLKLLEAGGRSYLTVPVEEICLESERIMARLLGELLRRELNTTEDKASDLAHRAIRTINGDRETVDINRFVVDEVLAACEEAVGMVWTKTTAADKQQRVADIRANPSYFRRRWDREVVPYFSGKYSTSDIARRVLGDGEFIILDIQSSDQSIQKEIMHELFRRIKVWAEIVYKRTQRPVNAEIFIDEAPRWVPQFDDDNGGRVIVDAVNTTRAYGLSWTFLTQRLTAIHKDILAQTHTKWFGRNLGTGADRAHMLEQLGQIGMDIYDTLQLNQGYFYLGVGDEMNLGSGRAPMAVMGWDGDVNRQLMDANPHIWGGR